MRKPSWIFFVGLLCLVCLLQAKPFEKHNEIPFDQLENYILEKPFTMSLSYGKTTYLKFSCSPNSVYFEIALGKDASDPLNIKQKLIEHYPFVYKSNEDLYLYAFEVFSDGKKHFNQFQARTSDHHFYSPDYSLTQRRVLLDTTPHKLSAENLKEIIHEHPVLIYTGAGLSKKSHIPDIYALMNLLNLEEGDYFFESVEKIVENPLAFTEKIQLFYDLCMHADPNPAHYAIKELVYQKKAYLLTENLDILHEKTGLLPYRIHAKSLKEESNGHLLQKFNYLICIGLSHDERGFIEWYKKKNPAGKIVSIDLKKPCYLDNDDYLVQGDLQIIVPNLAP